MAGTMSGGGRPLALEGRSRVAAIVRRCDWLHWSRGRIRLALRRAAEQAPSRVQVLWSRAATTARQPRISHRPEAEAIKIRPSLVRASLRPVRSPRRDARRDAAPSPRVSIRAASTTCQVVRPATHGLSSRPVTEDRQAPRACRSVCRMIPGKRPWPNTERHCTMEETRSVKSRARPRGAAIAPTVAATRAARAVTRSGTSTPSPAPVVVGERRS